jgi:predicted dehydrogenase
VKNPSRREFLGTAAVAAVTVGSGVTSNIIGANSRINLAVLGIGQRGLLKEAVQFADESGIRIAALCDTWKDRRDLGAAYVKEKLGYEPDKQIDYQDVFSRKDIDAVLISTPDHQHCAMLSAAVKAGKDVYVEKPLAFDFDELKKSVADVRNSGQVVQVGTQIRSLPASRGARELYESGKLGKVFKIEQSRNAKTPFWHQKARPNLKEAEVDWARFLFNRKGRDFDPDVYSAWMGYREFCLGVHTQLMVHFIDTVHYITGAVYPEKVTALANTYIYKDKRTCADAMEVLMDYPKDGFLVRYGTSFGAGDGNFFRFYGENGTLNASKWSWNDPFTIEEKDGKAAGQAPLGKSTHHMKNFFNCIKSREKPSADIESGLGHAVASLMAEKSIVEGRTVSLEELNL